MLNSKNKNFFLRFQFITRNWVYRVKPAPESGFAGFLITIIIFAVMVGIAFSITTLTLGEIKISRNIIKSSQAYYIAEAGTEDALLRLFDDTKDLPSGTELPYKIPITIDGETATATIDITDQPGYKKFIDSQGDVKERIRKVRAIVGIETTEASFHYGAQVGDGGLVMQNRAIVHGNVFSNGDIQGDDGPTITGDAIAASSSYIGGQSSKPIIIGGSAWARNLQYCQILGDSYASGTTTNSTIGNSTTTSDLHSDVILGGEVWGDAYYYTSISGATVHGTTTTGTPPTDIEPKDFAIPDSKIEEWKQRASSGGTIASDDERCLGGEYIPPDGTSLGPIKIECDVNINDGNQITVTGYIWVEGNLTVQDQGALKLDSSFGDLSSAIIVDYPADHHQNRGLVTVQDGAEISGSGATSSYLMVISQNNSAETEGGITAINVRNSSVSSIFYAPHGKIGIENKITLTEVTAYQIELKNASELKYEIGLADLHFSSGPGGRWEIKEWKEIE